MQKIATFIKKGLYKTSIKTMSNYAGKYRDAGHGICKKKKKKKKENQTFTIPDIFYFYSGLQKIVL